MANGAAAMNIINVFLDIECLVSLYLNDYFSSPEFTTYLYLKFNLISNEDNKKN